MSAADDYEQGRCRDCPTKIQPLGPSSRCHDCSQKRQNYIDSDWGLEQLIAERNRNLELRLCFLCGSGLDESDRRLCLECQLRSDSGDWSRDMHRRGSRTADTNPYVNVWDHFDDNSGYLTPSYGVMANRFKDKARYYNRMAERGGPRGREYAEDARIYNRVADKLQQEEDEARRLR